MGVWELFRRNSGEKTRETYAVVPFMGQRTLYNNIGDIKNIGTPERQTKNSAYAEFKFTHCEFVKR